MAEDALRFGPFRLDLAGRALYRGGVPVRLGDRALDVLCVLAEAKGAVVSKDELMARVWPGLIVEENNLQVHISALRKLLDAENSGFGGIVTLPRRGYCLSGFADAAGRRPDAPLPSPERPTIALLPFENMTGDPTQEYFVDGMAEEIITALSRIGWLSVIARNSSSTYKGRVVDVKQVGRDLGVRYVLEGSVRRAGERVRITTQLIDPETGAQLWADRFDGVWDNIFELQDQVSARVAAAIEPRVQLVEIQRGAHKPTEKLDANDCYLRGMAQLSKYTEPALADAVGMFRRARALDPDYIAAAAMISGCRTVQYSQGWGSVSRANVAEAIVLAREAVERSRYDAETLAWSAVALHMLAGEHGAAASAVDRALLINPNSTSVLCVDGLLAGWRNRPDRAVASLQRAIRLSPLDPLVFGFNSALAFAHLLSGEFSAAITCADQSLYHQPRHAPALRIKLVAAAYCGRADEAKATLRQICSLDPLMTISRYRSLFGSAMAAGVLSLLEHGLYLGGMAE
jgi:TolB-like protein